MNEMLRDWVASIAAEMQRRQGWMEFEGAGGAALLVGGDIECGEYGVAFEDDSGLRAEIAYEAIRAIRTGRQGETGGGRARRAPAFSADLAA